MKINDETTNVLANSRIEDLRLYLPPGQLDRKLYVDVNKVLEAIGGKWNRKEKAHLFETPPADILEEILLTGEYTNQRKEYDFFETPEALAKQLVDMAGIISGESVLEPSAGRGAIAKHMPGCDCIELEEKNRKYLYDEGFYLVGDDFLLCQQKYDVIVANPPFSKQKDIDHVTHMINLANRQVVSIVSASILFRDNKKTTAFRELVDSLGGEITPLPDKSFSESGTNVRTCVVCVDTRRC